MSERKNVMRIAACIAAIFVCAYFLGANALFSTNIVKNYSSQISGFSSENTLEGGMDALAGEDILRACSQIRSFVRYTSGQNGKYLDILCALVYLTAGVINIFWEYRRLEWLHCVGNQYAIPSYIHKTDGKKREIFIDRSKFAFEKEIYNHGDGYNCIFFCCHSPGSRYIVFY